MQEAHWMARKNPGTEQYMGKEAWQGELDGSGNFLKFYYVLWIFSYLYW